VEKNIVKKVVTRFAPSPTGTLHIGGVRTALFNYVYAKKYNGLFLVRIEDTDRVRSTKEFEKNILDSLHSIGLSPDLEPINQSERNEIYSAAAQKIIDSKQAYYCECSIERLDKMRSDQQANGQKPQYDGRCRDLNLDKSDKRVLRLKTPLEGEIVVKDFVRGDIVFNNSELDDLIILRGDGSPTYHLCNVVDDYEQGVTTVIRGEDHTSNTPRQMHIQNALGYPELEYAHLPLVLGEDKKRLSKRHAATSLEEYQDIGYLDSAILNTLARLGWSKGDSEVFYLEDLIRDFEISEVQKSGAIFDITKLDFLNSQHMANLSLEDFKNYLTPFMIKHDIDINTHPKIDLLIESMRSSGTTFSNVADNLKCYFLDVESYNENAINKFIGDSDEVLQGLKSRIADIADWSVEGLDNLLADYREEKNLKVPQVNQPLRIALTGSTNSPSLGLTLFLFDQIEVVKRINDLMGQIHKES
jgi:glutamyl-tRNA synthetase|tara:strand:+ start:1153 stop:2568 length:1416 start_codon:yes stop_codon:yes gene_type:complete